MTVDTRKKRVRFLLEIIVLLLAGVFILTLFLPGFLVFPGRMTQREFGRDSIDCPQTSNDRLVDLTTASGETVVMRVKGEVDLYGPKFADSISEKRKTPKESQTSMSVQQTFDENGHSQKESNEISTKAVKSVLSNTEKSVSESVLNASGSQKEQRIGILFFYGNGACLAYCDKLAERFRRMGAVVGIPDYIGYGASTGNPSEKKCYETADAAYDFFTKDLKIDPKNLVIVGHSLGSAVAVDLAVRRGAGRLIVCSGFTSLPEVAAVHYPRFLVSIFLRYQFNSAEKLTKINSPVLFLHGTADRIVPKEMSERNYEIVRKSGQPSNLVFLAGQGHNIINDNAEDVYTAIDEFLH